MLSANTPPKRAPSRRGRGALILGIAVTVLAYPLVLLAFHVPIGMLVAITTAMVLLALEAVRQVVRLTGDTTSIEAEAVRPASPPSLPGGDSDAR